MTHPILLSCKSIRTCPLSSPLTLPSSSYRHPCFTSHNSPPEHVQLDRKPNTAALTAPRVFHTRPGLLVDPSALASPTTASPPGLYILRYYMLNWAGVMDRAVTGTARDCRMHYHTDISLDPVRLDNSLSSNQRQCYITRLTLLCAHKLVH